MVIVRKCKKEILFFESSSEEFCGHVLHCDLFSVFVHIDSFTASSSIHSFVVKRNIYRKKFTKLNLALKINSFFR